MQATNNILLIRPASFGFNSQTETSNTFQKQIAASETDIMEKARAEFDAVAVQLKSKGINVIVFEDHEFPAKPDAVFPNNWISFHPDGTVILYPMQSCNRRPERRKDIIDTLGKEFFISRILDLTGYEKENKFLEGTGSIVFDHIHKLAYACLSPRTDKDLFEQICSHLHYKPVYFRATSKEGKEIYHTNVMMCMGEKFAVLCLDAITNEAEKAHVIQQVTLTGRTLISISFTQMENFAGNMLELKAPGKKSFLALSQSAMNNLTGKQKQQIEAFCELLPLSIPTIETIGGGSARCMIAEIFLQRLNPGGVSE